MQQGSADVTRAACVQALWRIVHAFPLEQKKRFLSFCTGSDRCARLAAVTALPLMSISC